jgi:succinate dehydrogenase / fumarate reductase iron-sulfur subunit
MKLNLKIWRQKNCKTPGKFESYTVDQISDHASFLEMLDILNEDLIKKGQEAIEFDNDCREGVCGSCSMVINGQAHGPDRGTATCQVHMRVFKDGDTIVVEPWRSKSFPIVKDLVVDRSALDRIITAGGYISTKSGPHPDANCLPIPKPIADEAMDAAACIGCGACVAACPNSSASLFTAAKISQLALLPQGQPEAKKRVVRMVDQMDKDGFGHCTNIGECEAACPKSISIEHIARMKREYLKALVSGSLIDRQVAD